MASPAHLSLFSLTESTGIEAMGKGHPDPGGLPWPPNSLGTLSPASLCHQLLTNSRPRSQPQSLTHTRRKYTPGRGQPCLLPAMSPQSQSSALQECGGA